MSTCRRARFDFPAALLLAVSLGAGLAAAGCKGDADSAVPPPGVPPLATAPLPPAESPTGRAPSDAIHATTAAGLNPVAPVGETLPAGHPPLPAGHPSLGDPAAMGASSAPSAPSAMGAPPSGAALDGTMPGGTFDAKESLAGQITVDKALATKAAAGDTIFLVARQDDGSERGGAILGVKRLTVGEWPLAFQLDGRDAMQPGTHLAGKVLLTARVDKDGDAITRQPGDLVAVAHVVPPQSTLQLVFDKALP